jgi:hypothetical protein
MSGAVTLGDIADRMLEVCKRRGRRASPSLIELLAT